MLKVFLLILFGITLNTACLAQFTPPGMGNVNTAEWFAVGLKQTLNQKETITSATYFGLGRTSNPDDYNLSERSAIYVVNEEITHHFKKHWQYSGALSYRWQNRYKPDKPFELDDPRGRQEVRIYGRFSYLKTIKKAEFSITYRPEIRFFYNPDFTSPEETMQFRSRFSGKMSLSLNPAKTQKIITSAEFLFATNKTTDWDRWKYYESRFCLYYSIAPAKQKVIFYIGYMNNLLGNLSGPVKDAHYLAIDITIKNPFKKHKTDPT